MLLFEIGVEWKQSGRQFTGSLVTSHECSVGVLGESDILKLLGVPSFLLLPGFLMIATFIALRKYLESGKNILLDAKTPEFWLFAITLSLLTALLYPHITGLFGVQRDYLKGYGVRDVFQVWMGSILLGFLFWALFVGVINIYAHMKNLQKKRYSFSENDSPITYLQKLSHANVAFPLKQADVQSNTGTGERYFVIEEIREEGCYWVSPIIRCEWIGSMNDASQRKLKDQLNDANNPKALAKIFEKGKKDHRIKVTWKGSASIKHPKKIDEDKIKIRDDLSPRNCFEYKD